MVSERDKERMRRLGEALSEVENGELITGEAMRRLREWVRAERERDGIKIPDDTEYDEFPELRFYERARALGLARRRR